MKGIDRNLRNWSYQILLGYIELGQKVYDEQDYKELEQYYQEGEVIGRIDSDTDREEIKSWLSGLAKMVNERTDIQMTVDNLIVANLKKIEE
jgi:hypothetical protein